MQEPARRQPSLGGVFARGLAMGLAEVVPGVSGGTIAFVSGIYDRFVMALASFSHRSPRRLLAADWRTFAREHDLLFLAVLGVGMAISFLAAANIIRTLLASHGLYVFGFFFGLIAGSVLHIGSQTSWRRLLTWGVAGLLPGIAVGVFLAPHHASADASTAMIFTAGALAATAWLLPGVSGSFVLLLLGLYAPLLDALHELDLAMIGTFLGGLAVGMLAFAKFLARLLDSARGPLLALLTGLLAGSLTRVWPWRATGAEDAQLVTVLAVLVTMAAGALAVTALTWAARRTRAQRVSNQPG